MVKLSSFFVLVPVAAAAFTFGTRATVLRAANIATFRPDQLKLNERNIFRHQRDSKSALFGNLNEIADVRGGMSAQSCDSSDKKTSSSDSAKLAVYLTVWLTGLRPAPSVSLENLISLAPVGVFSALSHALSVLAMGAGAVSFAQIVKAAEPVFAAATNAVMLKDVDHPMVYAALLPIIGGVGIASLTELAFTWTALIAALASNQAAAFKNVVSKKVMKEEWTKKLGTQNTFAIVTFLAFLATLPLVFMFDAKDIPAVFEAMQKAGRLSDAVKYTIYSGLAFYFYNEASFLALDQLSPVTHSVANTLKRVVIIFTSCIVFNNPVTLMGAVGSGVAVGGTLLYSLAKRAYAKKGSAHGH